MVIALPESARAGGFSLVHMPLAGSTNAIALQAACEGNDRRWVVADRQDAGRGRHGRGWASPVGNLYASLGLVSPCPTRDAPKLGFVAGVALARAMRDSAPGLADQIRLKWPNDVLIDGAKASGLLLEGAVQGGEQCLAIGFGVNVAVAPQGLGRRVAALADLAPGCTVPMLFAALAERMREALAGYDQGRGFAAIRQAWLALALPIGTPLDVKRPEGAISGTFSGIDADGHLLLLTGQGMQTLLAGDVFLAGDDDHAAASGRAKEQA